MLKEGIKVNIKNKGKGVIISRVSSTEFLVESDGKQIVVSEDDLDPI